MDNLDIPDGGQKDDARSPDVFETPYEAEILGSELPDDKRTVSPGEEGPNTQGFQHGSWEYEHDNTDRSLFGTIQGDLGEVDENTGKGNSTES
jgi:hypothetical protein